ncbi:hypothetical protein AGMMS49982_24070 [Bacteroidia bacterium]|nr:hypothetical protein AGMMS49982_24070 [Bacteroidia bacterium]
MTPNVWSRVMYTVDLNGNAIKYYVNGILLATEAAFNATTDRQYFNFAGYSNHKGFSLDPAGVLLFAGGTGTIDVANVQFYDGIPTDWEMYRLGGVGTRQITNNRAADWAFGDNYNMDKQSGNPPSMALDGNPGTWMHSVWPPPAPYNVTPDTYWFVLDLKKRQTLASYTMQGRWSWWNWGASHTGVGPYNLEISDDNTNWTLIGQNTTANGVGGDVTEVYFDPTNLPSGRYLKVTQPANPSRGENALAFLVGEIFIFGPK